MTLLTLFVLIACAFASPDSQTPLLAHSGLSPIAGVSTETWRALNESVSGRLHASYPFSKACFSHFEGEPVDVDPEDCAFVQTHYTNETSRTARFGGQVNGQWETCQATRQGCLLDSQDPSNPLPTEGECFLGSVSSYHIDVQEPEDVSRAFAFSRSTRVPIVIKNTGHDYKGRSSAPDSLSLWTHKLQDMTYHPSFVPSACDSREPKQAVTLGAGVQWYNAYAFADQHNITLVGGSDMTVGSIGGWMQGGGHGALSNTMGLGVDRVLEITLVTPDNQFRTANPCLNEDLFFALRGGGGGTFGVVLSATILASPPVPIYATLLQLPNNTSLAQTKRLWSVLLDNAEQWAQEGWGGFVTADSALYLNPGVISAEEAKKSMQVLVDLGDEMKREGAWSLQAETKTWWEFFDQFAASDMAGVGENLALASRLIPHSLFDTAQSRESLLSSFLAAESIAPGLRFLVTTPYNTPGDGSTSVNPAWREAMYHVTVVTKWGWNATLDEVRGAYAQVSRAGDELRKAVGGVGAAYMNEADVHEPHHERVFFGEHYERLLAIKNKYDPDRLLDCWQCVGWNAEDPRFKCYV